MGGGRLFYDCSFLDDLILVRLGDIRFVVDSWLLYVGLLLYKLRLSRLGKIGLVD